MRGNFCLLFTRSTFEVALSVVGVRRWVVGETAEEDDSERLRSTFKFDQRLPVNGTERSLGQNVGLLFCGAHISNGN